MQVRLLRLQLTRLAWAAVLLTFATALYSQGNPPATADRLTKNCWTADAKTTTQGKCPRKITETSFLCLSPTGGGGVEGTLNVSRMDSLDSENLAPEVFAVCATENPADAIRVVDITYDVSINLKDGVDPELVELSHKCTIGSCDSGSSGILKGTLKIVGDGLRWERTDQLVIDFAAYHDDKHS